MGPRDTLSRSLHQCGLDVARLGVALTNCFHVMWRTTFAPAQPCNQKVVRGPVEGAFRGSGEYHRPIEVGEGCASGTHYWFRWRGADPAQSPSNRSDQFLYQVAALRGHHMRIARKAGYSPTALISRLRGGDRDLLPGSYGRPLLHRTGLSSRQLRFFYLAEQSGKRIWSGKCA